MCGYWIVMVITETTKSRTLATVCMLTEQYDYLLANISAFMLCKKFAFLNSYSGGIHLLTTKLLQILVVYICFNTKQKSAKSEATCFLLGQITGETIKK